MLCAVAASAVFQSSIHIYLLGPYLYTFCSYIGLMCLAITHFHRAVFKLNSEYVLDHAFSPLKF